MDHLRDVASHAGVALGTLYRRFRSKEDLLLAALELEVTTLEQQSNEVASGDTDLERVVGFFQFATNGLCDRPNLARALVRAIARGEEQLAQKVSAFHRRIGRLVTEALRGSTDAMLGDLPSAEQQQIADVLQQVWFAGLVGWAAGLHGQDHVVAQTRTAAELMLRGSSDGGRIAG